MIHQSCMSSHHISPCCHPAHRDCAFCYLSSLIYYLPKLVPVICLCLASTSYLLQHQLFFWVTLHQVRFLQTQMIEKRLTSGHFIDWSSDPYGSILLLKRPSLGSNRQGLGGIDRVWKTRRSHNIQSDIHDVLHIEYRHKDSYHPTRHNQSRFRVHWSR